MTGAEAGSPRVRVGVLAAVGLFVVYLATLAPDVTFWDAGEFIAAAHALGIPHPPGTPLYILLLNAWTKVVPLPFALTTNLFSALATAVAAGVTARLVQRATKSALMAASAALVAGGMSSVWLNATETEVYAASLALGVAMMWAGERAAHEKRERWTCVLAYLIVLAVPLHLSALVAAPAAITLASITRRGFSRSRLLLLLGVLILAIGAGRVSAWLTIGGALVVVVSQRRRMRLALGTLAIAALALSSLAFLYVRARFDPAINQGDSDTLRGLIDMIARRQYAVSPLWPRSAPAWAQIGNLAQYADWQIALSLGPTVFPSVFRSAFTVLFLVLGYQGAVAHWRINQRTWIAVAVLLFCGSFGVLVYLNLHPGPSIGYGILASNVVREARERDYFFVFAFWAWGIWSGIGAVAVARRLGRPAWTGALVAGLPIILNWRAVTRSVEPERSVPRVFAVAMLESTPRDGVLFVMGDNDSYPLWYAQEVLGIRADVTVVTVPLLPTTWYRSQISHRFGLLDSTDAARFDGSMEAAARIARGARAKQRPVAVTMMMTPAERARLGSAWTATGLVFAESRSPSAERRDTVTSKRVAGWIDEQLSKRKVRPAIDPVQDYFRRMLDCPRQLVESSRNGDASQLDSTCSYR